VVFRFAVLILSSFYFAPSFANVPACPDKDRDYYSLLRCGYQLQNMSKWGGDPAELERTIFGGSQPGLQRHQLSCEKSTPVNRSWVGTRSAMPQFQQSVYVLPLIKQGGGYATYTYEFDSEGCIVAKRTNYSNPSNATGPALIPVKYLRCQSGNDVYGGVPVSRYLQGDTTGLGRVLSSKISFFPNRPEDESIEDVDTSIAESKLVAIRDLSKSLELLNKTLASGDGAAQSLFADPERKKSINETLAQCQKSLLDLKENPGNLEAPMFEFDSQLKELNSHYTGLMSTGILAPAATGWTSGKPSVD
jgi:hypothetical protein